MPDQYRVDIATSVRKELRDIFKYIERDSSASAASRVIVKLLDAMESLSMFPHRFDVPRTGSPRGRSIRAMPVEPYIIRYRIDDHSKKVYVMHVRHGARKKP